MKKDRLSLLVSRFKDAKANGQLRNSSEATIRAWIDELLSVFGWDVQNTHQVLTEHTLGKEEREKLHGIGSTNTRPDYTLVNGNVMLAFLDAKSLAVNIEKDKDIAFQIRSYGWSIGAPFSVVTNFEQLAIYDCSAMPYVTDEAHYSRRCFLNVNDFEENFETLDMFLSRTNIISGNVKFVPQKGNALDEKFSAMLGNVRKSIAKSILLNNPIDSIETLSFYVQTIINRILFIRVCEARGLEEDGLLSKFADNDFWRLFCESSYADFYERYDGPMFKRIPPIQALKINNEPLVSFIRGLYYPSPYRFDVIPLKTLGDMYDLFLSYHLVMRNGEIYDELKHEFKKSNGAVTTPESLVKQVIKVTLPLSTIDNMSVSQILDLKIADIACGSGVFLVGAYDYLVETIERKLSSGQYADESYYANIEGKKVLSVVGRKEIINNCIYGVDINPEAVEVAKLSLSLKLIDNYSPMIFDHVGLLGAQILKGVGTNIKCGNSLVGADIELVCPSISEHVEELQATNAFDWKSSFPEVFSKGGFDFILGNPPYVEVKNYNVSLPCMASSIKTVFCPSRNGKIDLAIPFIEQGIKLLNDNGRLGYIIQKRFFKDQYGKGIRQLLTQEGHYLLNGVYDYEETDLFAGRTTYVAILVCDRCTKNNDYVWYANSQRSDNDQLLPSGSLSDTPWNFENAQLNALRMRLTNDLGTLSDICNVKVGVQVLWNDAYQIKADKVEGGLIFGHSTVEDNLVIEYNACKPLLCNEQFAPLTKREYTTFALFPYSVTDDGEVRELSFDEFSGLYPKAGQYLERHKKLICDNVEVLPSKNKNYNTTEHWHLYTRANNHGAIYQKICVPMTAQYTQAAVVLDTHIYCDNANMFFIQIPDVDETRLYALSAIINSTIFNTLARSIANPQRGGYFKFNKQFLDPVPVPREAFVECSKEITKLAGIAKRIEKTNEQIRINAGGKVSGLQISLKSLWSQLDLLCDKLYGITSPNDKGLIYSVIRKDRNPYGQEN